MVLAVVLATMLLAMVLGEGGAGHRGCGQGEDGDRDDAGLHGCLRGRRQCAAIATINARHRQALTRRRLRSAGGQRAGGAMLLPWAAPPATTRWQPTPACGWSTPATTQSATGPPAKTVERR